MAEEKANKTEYHLPGTNFAGPGTHVATRIVNRVLPTSVNDVLTMVHDIEYYKYSGNASMLQASDIKLANKVGFSNPAITAPIATKILFEWFGFDLGFNSTSTSEPVKVGYQLQYLVENDLEYQTRIKELGLDNSVFEF